MASTRLRRHLRGNVVAYLALFVALSGSAAALPGKGRVKPDDLARHAVKQRALKPGAVNHGKLRTGAVTNRKLRTGAVSSVKIADGSIVSVDLADAAVTSAKLAEGSVVRSKVGQGQINGGKLANGSVNSAKVRDGTLSVEDFAPGQLSDGFARSGDGVFTLPRAGPVLVIATFLSSCATDCSDSYAVQVDGTLVPGADFARSGDDDLFVTLVGLTAQLAAGDHQIELAASDGGAGATETAPRFSGVLLQ